MRRILMKLFTLAISIVVGIGATLTSAEAVQDNISDNYLAVVNMRMIKEVTATGKDITAQAEPHHQKLKERIVAFKQKLDRDFQSLLHKKDKLGGDEFERKFKAMERKRNFYLEAFENHRAKIDDATRKAFVSFSDQAKSVVTKLMKTYNAKVLVDSSTVLVQLAGKDLTLETINELDKNTMKVVVDIPQYVEQPFVE